MNLRFVVLIVPFIVVYRPNDTLNAFARPRRNRHNAALDLVVNRTLGLRPRDVLIRLLRRVMPLEVISHREVDLKPLIAALERLFKRGA